MIKELKCWEKNGLFFAGLIIFVILSSSVALAQSQIVISPNRYVVLDDPNAGTKAPGFFNPADVRGGNWGTNYWYGESTTIRAAAQVINDTGTPLYGITVTFRLKNPAGTQINTTTSASDNKGLAYYSFDLNNRNYWGYWTIEANATVSAVNINNQTSFALYWWGCAQCHGSENPGNWGSLYTPKSYYTRGYDFHKSQTKNKHTDAMAKGTCIICHQMYNGTPVNWRFTGNSPNINPDNEYSPDWHKGKKKCQDCHQGSNITTTPQGKNPEIAGCYDTTGCHPKNNNNLSGINSTTGYVVGGNYRTIYSFIPANTAKAHNGSTSIPCIVCHDAGHNISKPFNTSATSNTFTEFQQCTACHSGLQQHNNNLSCTVCHSQDAHAIKIFAQNATYVSGKNNPAIGNCTNCHQNASFLGALKIQPKAGSYTGQNAPQVPKPLNHSVNPLSGGLWNGTQSVFWDNNSQLSACNYCHGAYTLHNSSALGNISKVKGSNSLNQSLAGGTWCQNCHYKMAPGYAGDKFSPQPPEILNLSGLVPANSRAGTVFYNHSGFTTYDDAKCKSCHNNNLAAGSTSLNFSHDVAIGSAGGPDCISCHDRSASPPAAGALINSTAMNDSGAIHDILNSGASTSLSPENKKCWACHGDGSEPASGHPSNYKTPHTCEDCHITRHGLGINCNVCHDVHGASSLIIIPYVKQHYWNGTSIKTGAVTSCYGCHNMSEMMGLKLDPDGAGTVYSGANGGNNSTSHYGKKRSDYPAKDTNDYCYKCHNNASSVFPFIDSNNKTIANHSSSYPSSNPPCVSCHSTGRIHDKSLDKPGLTLPNSTFCTTCHGTSGTAGKNNLSLHNGSVDCTKCHLNDSKSIHPVRYLQAGGTAWSISRMNSVNCTDCHTGNGFGNAPVIPNPIKHSANPSNGTIWDTFWTSGNGSCYYCHSDTKHNTSALGSIHAALLDSNNSRNGDLTITTWCIDCHLDTNPNYIGGGYNPVPPLITANNKGNGNWVDHTNYLSPGIKDSNCMSCHILNGSYSPTSLNYSHSLNEGIAGEPNCIKCHNLEIGTGGLPGINFTSANQSVHYGMNRNNATANGFAPVVGSCWACHDSDGNVTSGHPDRYKNPKICTDCHIGTGIYNSSAYGAIVVSQHIYNANPATPIRAGNSTSNIGSCINCHENVSEMLLYNNDNDYGSFAGDGIRLNGGNMSSYHYGKPRPDLRLNDVDIYANCYYCHQNASTAFAGAMQNAAVSNSISDHTDNPGNRCTSCHNIGWIHNSTLEKPALSNFYCRGSCHAAGAGGGKPISKTHNSLIECWNCHQDPINRSQSQPHGMKFPQVDGSFLMWNKGTPANCTTCHVYNLVDVGTYAATNVPSLNHSTDSSSGRKWGNYWDNTSMVTACEYCHVPSNAIGIHQLNTELLGNVSTVKGSNTFNNPDLANSTWCQNCHYARAPEYKGNLIPKAPPEITNESLRIINPTFFNHSGLSIFNDSECRKCHGSALSGYSQTTLNFSHSVSIGGGEECIQCHGTDYPGATPSVASTFVNITAFNESIHPNINSTPIGVLNNDDCWKCHYNKDMSRQNVKKCDECHRKPRQWHGNANISSNLSELW